MMKLRDCLVLGLVTAAWGCADTSPDPVALEERGDDEAILALEGGDLTAQLDAALTSPVYQAPRAFERLGLMWDAPEGHALELRASSDGVVWSEWTEPTVVFDEDGSFAGHVDVPAGATQLQLRVIGAERAPTWLSVHAIDTIPLESDEEGAPEDEGEEIGTAEQELGSGGVKIHSRSEWGAKSPKCSISKHSPYTATIHHTVTPTNDSYSPQKRLRQIQSFHMYSNGWCDIGYNYLVSRDGRLWKGRGKSKVGAHVENHNTGNVGISFMGNYTSDAATKKQRCNVADLLRWLHQEHPSIQLERSDVKGHRQYGSTACPGNKLYSQIDSIVKLAKNGGCK